MTAKKNGSRIAFAIMAVFAIVTIYCAAVRMKADYRAHHEPATLSAQQISVRATPVCGLLGGGNGSLKETYELLQRVDANGAKHRIWVVDGIDAAGNCAVNTTWDAETGNLLIATHATPRRVPGKTPVFAPTGVTRAAWHWMETLGVGKTASRWIAPRQPELRDNTWKVVLCSDRYCATVLLDRDSHDLILLTVKTQDEAVRTS
jgi:hypothetical protein